jgi:ribokinase
VTRERAATAARGPSIAVVGSLNLDLVATVQRFPLPGETVSATSLDRFPGGKGANQAVAAARLGARVRMIGAVGGDAAADVVLGSLADAEVSTAGIRRVDQPTGTALITRSADGETEIVVVGGANAALAPDVGELRDEAVLCQLEIPMRVVEACAQGASGLVCLNASPASTLPEAVRRRVDLVVVNRLELSAIGALGSTTLVAVTSGAEGATLLRGGEVVARSPAPRVTAVDGTAAGDAFCAALVVALLRGTAAAEALREACVAGGLAASRSGAQPSLPTRAEVADALAAFAS